MNINLFLLYEKHQDVLDDLSKGKLNDEIKSKIEKGVVNFSQKYS